MLLRSSEYLVGVDEAGRGPLAGPVAVGLVYVATDVDLLALFPGLNDSKKLTEKKREIIFEELERQVADGAIVYSVKMRAADEIDSRGIAVVIREAIEEGLKEVCAPGDGKVWLDGSLKAPAMYEQETVIGGDGLIPAIMLASVAAKVTRDRLMKELHDVHPQYGFDRHKGYGTAAHMQTIKDYGLCDIHRKTFIHV